MLFTENFQLPCPDGEDYGAIALYMQRAANLIEDSLVEQSSAHEQFDKQPTAIWTTIIDSSPISTSGVTSPWSFSNSSVFRNYIPSTGLFFSNGVPTAGIYHLGFYVNTTCVGTVTNDSFRQIVFDIVHGTPGGDEVVASFSRRVQEENVAGGNFFGTEGIVEIGSDFANYSFDVVFSHGNSGSDMIIETGATAWFTRIGLNEVIEVS